MKKPPICARTIVISKYTNGKKNTLTMDGLADFAVEELGEITATLDAYVRISVQERLHLEKQLKQSEEKYYV